MSAITNTSPIPRPIMRLAALLLAMVAVILIAGTIIDYWRNATIEIPPAIVERSAQPFEYAVPTATPGGENYYQPDNTWRGTNRQIPGCATMASGQIECWGGWQLQPDTYSAPPAINSSLQIEPTPVAGGFRTSNGLTRSKQP